MKRIILLVICFSLAGCLEEENCVETDKIIRYRTETTEFYTISIPVYEMRCE